MVNNLIKELSSNANPKKARVLQGFFKTGKGEYGEGDKFLGVMVPKQRSIAKKYSHLALPDLQKLLNSKIHEHRLTALLILSSNFEKSDDKQQKEIFNFYIKNAKRVNNWDLVDLSAPNIVGSFLLDKDKKLLYNLAKSSNLWEKRISIVSTFPLIRNNRFSDTLEISRILMNDKHDLIHKAVGWMLREVGKRDFEIEKGFIDKHHKRMPRTMLRYAIEQFPARVRKSYLNRKISQ
jgi:3-methyladenine DNA glycosylase AlkD